MPYATPSPSHSPVLSNNIDNDGDDGFPPIKLRPKHRRSRSSHPTFSDDRGPGAFASLPRLPRRKSTPHDLDAPSPDTTPKSTPSSSNAPKKPLFHFSDDQSTDSDDDDHHYPSSSHQSTSNSLGLSVDLDHLAPPATISSGTSTLPFPSKASPVPSPDATTPNSPLIRTPSTPLILLSNGKPLKPSLKSSYSTPNIPSLRVHTRAQSEPATPMNGSATPPVKNVHFAEKEALQSVRLFDRSGKPANVSKPNPLADETETETEYDSSANNANGGRKASASSNLFPFPSMPVSSPSAPDATFEVDTQLSSPVPAPRPSEYANLHLESIVLPPTKPVALRGNVLVRNIAFAKDVAVRFTLDEWQTTSEVTCKYVASLPALPAPFHKPISNFGDLAALTASMGSGSTLPEREDDSKTAWDRFSFSIRLEDFDRKLAEKTLWLVVRYTSPGLGEWWDNNDGQNYRVGFRRAAVQEQQQQQQQVQAKPPLAVIDVNGSQQRTFSAPPTLKRTPMTGQLTPPDAEAGPSLPRVSLPSVRPLLPRAHTSPHPIAGGTQTFNGLYHSHVASTTPPPPQSKKLSLMNYSAPAPPVTPPQTPPTMTRTLQALPGLKAPASIAVDESSASADARPPSLIGGMPATAPRTELQWPVLPSSSSSAELMTPSSSESSPVTVRSPVSEQGMQLLLQQSGEQQPAYGLSSLTSDSSYSALVKQWCFVQSPTPSPPATSTLSSLGHGNSSSSSSHLSPAREIETPPPYMISSGGRGSNGPYMKYATTSNNLNNPWLGLSLRSESPILAGFRA